MKNVSFLAGLALTILSGSTSAYAAARTFVSTAGSDSGGCSVSAPCRSFSYAITQTNPGGEMVVLSSGGYGPFTISQAISIVAPVGTLAFISAPTGMGITVNASPQDIVTLSGFYIDGLGTGTHGLQVLSGGTVSISGSTITGFTASGIDYEPTIPTGVTGAAHLNVTSSLLYRNGANGIAVIPAGPGANPSGTSASIAVKDTIISNVSGAGTNAIVVDSTMSAGNVFALIEESTIKYASGNAVTARSLASGTKGTAVRLLRSAVYSVGNALVSDGAAASIALESTSVSVASTVATTSNGGYVLSFGNNGIYPYTTLGTITPLALK